MNIGYMSRALAGAFTTARTGPSLYDICDPVLRGEGAGDPHLRRFYKVALANPVLKPILSRAGLATAATAHVAEGLRASLLAARDDASPDWAAIGAPVAALLDGYPSTHPQPAASSCPPRPPSLETIDKLIHACAADLLRSERKLGYIPAYAAFNLIGDPDFRGRDLITALTGLKARAYKNSTLLFNVARAFLLANPHVAAVVNPPWTGVAEPMWEPVQIRHRSAYYDAFFAEALLDYIKSGVASADEAAQTRVVVDRLVDFCLTTSRERVPAPSGEGTFDVVTALAPHPHARFSPFFRRVKEDLGFGLYVPDCDTTACSFSAAIQAGSCAPILAQPLIDFYAGYQVGEGNNRHVATVPVNDTIDFDGGILTWIENADGCRPYGNDLDPTLSLDVLEVAFRSHACWHIEKPARLAVIRRIVAFQRRMADTGAFADPRSHIYYLPELYSAYFGRTWAAFQDMPLDTRRAVDPDGSFDVIRSAVLRYVRDDLIAHEMNAFDAALALLALAKLGAPQATFTAPLAVLADTFGEGRRHPYKAYEWNKMKTPTRIRVGGPEVTSAFVLSALVHARKVISTSR